jgi:hypothetical protein
MINHPTPGPGGVERTYDHSKLPGNPASVKHLQAMYTKGHFKYQFSKGKGKRSRVMTCDNAGEFEFVLTRAKRGVIVFVQPITA